MNKIPSVLATDLDGTLIPLANNEFNRHALESLRRHFQSSNDTLVYVTGRHLASVRNAITENNLPLPDWIICDVGTTIYEIDTDGRFQIVQAYVECLSEIVPSTTYQEVRDSLCGIAGLRLQESEKQGRFKLSFYTDGSALELLTRQVQERIRDLPLSIISSVDPFNGDGLIDILPQGASKAFALRWWSQHSGYPETQIIFAGDSGNDVAALTAGYLTIVVGNAQKNVVDTTLQAHLRAGWENRLHIAESAATSGVLEGCRELGLIPP